MAIDKEEARLSVSLVRKVDNMVAIGLVVT
jgi:hypothetical protein